MIRTVIVDDDFMAVSVHRQFTERVPGFEIVGTASTGASALALVAELRPDLVLLDMYLPDVNGVEVLRRLRATTGLEVDVIAITSAKDVDVLRGAMHLGVAHYLVKPFTFEIFRERLESYAVARQRLEHMAEADQRSVDRVYGTLRSAGADSLPKNISSPTKKVGAPKAPRATAVSVLVFRRSLACGLSARASSSSGSKPALASTAARTSGSPMFLRLFHMASNRVSTRCGNGSSPTRPDTRSIARRSASLTGNRRD